MELQNSFNTELICWRNANATQTQAQIHKRNPSFNDCWSLRRDWSWYLVFAQSEVGWQFLLALRFTIWLALMDILSLINIWLLLTELDRIIVHHFVFRLRSQWSNLEWVLVQWGCTKTYNRVIQLPLYTYNDICIYIYSKAFLNRPSTGPTLSGPFMEVVSLGS